MAYEPVQILAPDPGADMAAQEQARRRQAMAQLLMQQQTEAAPVPEFPQGGDSGESDTGFKQGDYLGSLFNGENPASSGPDYAPGYHGPSGGNPNPFASKYAFGDNVRSGAGHYKLNDEQRREMAAGIRSTADKLGIDPKSLAAVMSFETGGTLDPWKAGPTTKWGQHRGLIQWGEPQARQYGVSQGSSISDQLGAVGTYLREHGVRPGMDLNHVYSAVLHGNANSGLDVRDANGTSANTGASNMLRTGHINALDRLEAGLPRQQAASVNGSYQPPQAPLPSMAADTLLTMPERGNAPAPAAANPPAPAPAQSAPLPPQRPPQADIDALAARQAPARQLTASPQQEDDDPFSQIGNFLEGIFGGGDQPAQGGTQVAANSNGALGWGQGGYQEPGRHGHGIIGMVMDALNSGQQVPPPVINQLLNSSKASERYLAMTADPTQTPQARQVYEFLARNEYEKEKQGERQFSAPHMNEYGQMVQEGANGQVHVISNPQHESKPAKIQEFEYVNSERAKAGQPPLSYEEFNKSSHDGANHRHVIGGALVDDDGKVIYEKPNEAMFTPEAIDDAAHALNRGDDSHLKNVGRGAQGVQTIAAIRNRAAEFRRQTNQTVEDIMQNAAEYGGTKARERVLGQQEGNAVTAAIGAGNALRIARGAVNGLGNGEFTDVNAAINAYKNHTGRPDVQKWGQAAATLANTYARAVNPKGLPHESVLRDAIERLSAARSPEQLHAIMDIMQQEIEQEVNAPRQARETIKGMDKGVPYRVDGPQNGGTTSSGLKWSVE